MIIQYKEGIFFCLKSSVYYFQFCALAKVAITKDGKLLFISISKSASTSGLFRCGSPGFIFHGEPAGEQTTHMCLYTASLRPPLKAFWTDLGDIVKQMINLYPCQVRLCTDDLLQESCRNAIYPNWLLLPTSWWQTTLHHYSLSYWRK